MTQNPFDPALFRPDVIAPETLAFAENLRKQTLNRPPLGSPPPEGGAAPVFPRPPASPRARTLQIDAPGAIDVSSASPRVRETVLT